MLKKLIKLRLKGYKQQYNVVDDSKPLNVSDKKRVAIIGSGLAGMSAAAYLAPRGFEVEVFEKDSFVGGKIGSWAVTFEDGFQTNVEHGFHGFFRQYHNLLRLLGTIGAAKNLISISDYLIKTKDLGEFSFRNIDTTPILNLISMARQKIYSLSEMMSLNKAKHMLPLLRYDRENTFAKFDDLTFKDFSDSVSLPKELQLVFTTFSRAFFAEPQYMSMAELIKSFHFYFLSNDLGILYDVLDDDFEQTLWKPFQKFLEPFGTKIHLNHPVSEIDYINQEFRISNKAFKYIIIASDVKNTPKIFHNSSALKKAFTEATDKISNVKTSQKYAVLRIWIDKNIQKDLPFFIFTDAIKILDSVTIYHQMEKTSTEWVKQNGGGIFELHSYAVPDDMKDGSAVKQQLLKEFEDYFPEIRNFNIKYEYFQFRDDFSAFHANLYKNRPEYKTEIPRLFLAGDWVKLPVPAMLMEAATTSALFAANEILKSEDLREEPVLTVPLKGLFA